MSRLPLFAYRWLKNARSGVDTNEGGRRNTTGQPVGSTEKSSTNNTNKKQKENAVMSTYYKFGEKAGRNGSDPSPPSHTLLDALTGISKEDVEDMKENYQAGYQAGSLQRLADALEDDD